MAIYYLFFSCFYVAAFLEVSGVRFNRAGKKMILTLFFLLFIILSTIYYGPVGDVYTYENYFYHARFDHLIKPIEPYEKGYILLNTLLGLFTKKYWVLRFVQAVLVIGIWKCIIVSDKDNFLYGKEFLALFCLWSLKNGNIFITRSSFAVVICIYSIKYIQNKDIKRFFLMIAVACLFHTLSVVFIPAYWLFYWKKPRKYFYFIIFLAAVLSPFLPAIISFLAKFIPFTYIRIKILHYINDVGLVSYTSYSYLTTFLKSIINMGSSIIMLEVVSKTTDKRNEKFEGRLNLYSLGVLIYFVAINVSTGMTRAALPYMDMQMIMLPQIFEIPFIRKNVDNRIIVFLIFSFYLFLRMYVNIRDSVYTTIFS